MIKLTDQKATNFTVTDITTRFLLEGCVIGVMKRNPSAGKRGLILLCAPAFMPVMAAAMGDLMVDDYEKPEGDIKEELAIKGQDDADLLWQWMEKTGMEASQSISNSFGLPVIMLILLGEARCSEALRRLEWITKLL